MLVEEKTKVEILVDNLKDYLSTRMDLALLMATEKGAVILSNLVASITLLVIFLFFILFGSIALAMGISENFNNAYSGFLIVAIAYLTIGIVLFFVQKKSIKDPVSNLFIKQILKKENRDE